MPPALLLDKFPFHIALKSDLPRVDAFVLGPREAEEAQSGLIYKLREADIRYFQMDAKCGFPQPDSAAQTFEGFSDWLFDHDDKAFLIMSTRVHAYKKVETFVASAAQTDFLLGKRYIEEGYGFTVTKDGSPESATVEDNGTTPFAKTAAMTGGEDVVVTYFYWIPVELLNDPLSRDTEQLAQGSLVDDESSVLCRIVVQEIEPGAHLAV